MKTSYITSALKPEHLPRLDLPEIAFIGRSNAGKSSLLNNILGRRNLARYGRTPGQTQMINFFSVDDKMIFADLPGYGYSAAARSVAGNWQRLAESYLRRHNIKEFLYLMDCRRDPADEDLALMYLLGRQLSLIVVMTKVDKISRAALKKNQDKLEKLLKENDIDLKVIVPVSSLKKTGIEELKKMVFAHMPDCQLPPPKGGGLKGDFQG